MNIIPIVFAYDNRMSMPAAICIYSLLANAKTDTFYDIFILSSPDIDLNTTDLDNVVAEFNNVKVTHRKVSREFEDSFLIRGISCTTYYRLLIPDLIREYDKIVYSDVDVIFRDDLSEIFHNTNLNGYILAGVNSINHLDTENSTYYRNIGIDPAKTIYAGNLIINSKLIRETGISERFKAMAHEKLRFQDMDIINIICKNNIKYLGPEFCLTNYIYNKAVNDPGSISALWSKKEISKALVSGIVHYNGQKPWNGYCPGFDIWWEYYRKSPVFDQKFYFNFFYNKLDELDTLSLWKRIKILVRFFKNGRKHQS